jgi:hypothetical protein
LKKPLRFSALQEWYIPPLPLPISLSSLPLARVLIIYYGNDFSDSIVSKLFGEAVMNLGTEMLVGHLFQFWWHFYRCRVLS